MRGAGRRSGGARDVPGGVKQPLPRPGGRGKLPELHGVQDGSDAGDGRKQQERKPQGPGLKGPWMPGGGAWT